MARASRVRLDELVHVRGLAPSRTAAKAMVMAGLVMVAGKVCDKAGTLVDPSVPVAVKSRPRFVSRGGEKLAAALDAFGVDVVGRSALDVGSSTGGFVDCLLQRGVARVVALDVGRGQLDVRLRDDPRVYLLEGCNARYTTPDLLPWQPDLVTMDVSFISVTKVLPAVVLCLAPLFEGVILVKPQFEAGPKEVGKGGVVRDSAVHRRVLDSVSRFIICELDLALLGVCRSALPGVEGNVEFFLHLARGGETSLGLDNLEEAIARAVREPAVLEAGEGE
jgi:23S rRNA (cytidine1920-2'-O)/16S rRNA (cytidine1409-2'-O)-methyltransferase